MDLVVIQIRSLKEVLCIPLYLWLITQCLVFNSLHAQDTNRFGLPPDSISSDVLDKYLGLSFDLAFSKPDEALEYGRKALLISRSLNRPKEEAKALENIGYIYYDRFVLDSALIYFEQALLIDRKSKNILGSANRLNAIGQVYYKKQKYSKALGYYNKALKLLKNGVNEKVEASIYNNRSLVYKSLGDYPKAVKNLLLALHINERSGDKRKKALNLANLGHCYQEMNDLSKAAKSLTASLLIAQELKNVQLQVLALINLGLVNKIKGDQGDTLHYSTAWKELNEALSLSRSLGDKDNEAIALQNLATLSLSRNDNELSERFIHQSIALKKEIGKEQTLTYAYIHLGTLARKRGQLKEALEHVKMAIDNAETYGVITAKRKALALYAELLSENKQYDEAYRTMVQHQKVADSLLNEEKVKAIAIAEASFQTSKKQQEIVSLQNTNAQQRQHEIYLYSIVFLSLIGGILLLLLLRKKLLLKSKENFVQQLQLQHANLEQKHLKGQLESYTLKLIQSNEAVLRLQEELDTASKSDVMGGRLEPESLNFTSLKVLRDEDWEHFKKLFESVYPTFLWTLKTKHPHLSANDVRLATLHRLGLSTREMASILGIEIDSVKKARHRLRKKLSNEIDLDIKEYFQTFS